MLILQGPTPDLTPLREFVNTSREVLLSRTKTTFEDPEFCRYHVMINDPVKSLGNPATLNEIATTAVKLFTACQNRAQALYSQVTVLGASVFDPHHPFPQQDYIAALKITTEAASSLSRFGSFLFSSAIRADAPVNMLRELLLFNTQGRLFNREMCLDAEECIERYHNLLTNLTGPFVQATGIVHTQLVDQVDSIDYFLQRKSSEPNHSLIKQAHVNICSALMTLCVDLQEIRIPQALIERAHLN